MSKNINTKPFDETTRLKLDIFGECFKEWFPVFIHSPWYEKVYIFDFFAGSGTDSNGVYGSPLVLLNEAKGDARHFCGNTEKPVSFIFNESMKTKSQELTDNVDIHISKCEQDNQCGGCVYDRHILQFDFKDLFQEKQILDILNNKNFGKFILLDQYGFKQIDDVIFQELVSFPKTDFIFFISSSFIKRFQEHPNVKAYINTEKLNFDESKPMECHRIIANYFQGVVPKAKEYYIHHFTIQKEKGKGNYYGLIFGTNHTLGMEKFLKVCWNKDRKSGEANFNIDNDFRPDELFYTPDTSNKKQRIKEILKKDILDRRITDNITGLKFTLQQGCEPILFIEVIKDLEMQGKIKRTGDLNYRGAGIHRIKKLFNIELIT
jgi:three-Cys-motif partner protein